MKNDDKKIESNDIKNIFKSKKVRYGTFSAITAMVVIAVLVVINLFAGQFDVTFDLTRDKMFSISDRTKTILDDLDQDIRIYALFQTGNQNVHYTEILEQYSSHSSRVRVEYRDPYIYPTFVNQYKDEEGNEIPVNSIIVESGNRHRVILPDELITYEYDYYTFTQYASTLNIEAKVTNAIEFVLQTYTPKIYAITGHGEMELSNYYLTALADKNFAYDTLNLLTIEAIPDDCAALFITAPERDYTADEAEMVMNYLRNDGRALIIAKPMLFDSPNFDGILEAYGVELEYMVIIEGDSNYTYPVAPQFFFPIPSDTHLSTRGLATTRSLLFVGFPQNVRILDVRKSSLTIETVVTTTNRAYGKIDPDTQTLLKEDGDPVGPFNIAVAITDSYYMSERSYKTQLLVSGAASLLDESMSAAAYDGNREFIMSSLNWLIDRNDTSTYIAPKSLQSYENLTITSAEARTIKILSMGFIPGAVLVVGLVVWFTRRHK